MPRRPARARRNPHPDLLDYLTDEFIAAVVRAGDAYRKQGDDATDVWNPEPGAYGVMLPKKKAAAAGAWWLLDMLTEVTYLLFEIHTYPVHSLSIISYQGDPDLAASVVAQAAEETGFVVYWEGEDVSFQNGFVSVDPKWSASVYVPSWFPDRERFAAACFKPTYNKREQAYVSKVMAQNAFPSVPKQYRRQIGDIVRQAYETNDLGTYLQAKELAALVAE